MFSSADMNWKRPSTEWIIAAVAALGVAAANAYVHGWFLEHYTEEVGFDDGHIVAFATRLIQNHWLPYVDAICHRGPLLYWYAALIQRLFGPYSWVGIRVCTLVAALLATASSFFAGAAARRPLAGVFSGGIFAYLSTYGMPPGAGLSLGGEHVAVPLALCAVGWVALAVNFGVNERRRGAYLLLAGACACLAMLAKQTSALLVFPLFLWVLAWAFGTQGTSGRAACWRLVKFALGWAATAAAVLALYAYNHALHTFVYWFFTYNMDVYMAPYRYTNKAQAVLAWVQDQPIVALAVALPFGAALVSPLFEIDSLSPRRLLAAYARVGFETTSAIIGISMMASALATMRFWPHYFLIVGPWAGMIVGLRAEQALRARPALGRTLGYAGLSALIVSIVWFGAIRRITNMTAEQKSGSWAPARPDAICTEVDRYTKASDGLFAWGFDADLYISCQRRPVTRYVTSHFVAGVVPPFWAQPNPAYVARDSRATVAAEIRAARPPLILDDPAALSNFGMKQVPELAEILDHDYCSLGAVTGRGGRTVQLYLRKERAECAGHT